jgi:hypothetical protein
VSAPRALARTADGAWNSASAASRAGSTPSAAARMMILLLGFYRRFVSPALPRACRFHPSCSVYALEAVTRHGFLRGTRMAAIRLCKCHPLHEGGFDPVK